MILVKRKVNDSAYSKIILSLKVRIMLNTAFAPKSLWSCPAAAGLGLTHTHLSNPSPGLYMRRPQLLPPPGLKFLILNVRVYGYTGVH